MIEGWRKEDKTLNQKTVKFYTILPDSTNKKVWLMSAGNRWTLPYYETALPAGTQPLDVGYFNTTLKAQIGINVMTRYSTHWKDPQTNNEVNVFTLENPSPEWKGTHGHFFEHETLNNLTFIRPIHRSLLGRVDISS